MKFWLLTADTGRIREHQEFMKKKLREVISHFGSKFFLVFISAVLIRRLVFLAIN